MSKLDELEKRIEQLEKKDILYMAKYNENAIFPTKNKEDAGYDLYACVKEDMIVLKPNETLLIPTGISTAFPDTYMFKIMERSSTGTKGFSVRAGVVDSGYRGEIKVAITNVNNCSIVITNLVDKDGNILKENEIPDKIKVLSKSKEELCYSKEYALQVLNKNIILYPMSKAIAQGVLLYLGEPIFKEISYEQLKNMKSIRKDNGFGSSNK